MKILPFRNNYFLNNNKNNSDFYQTNISDKIAPADSVEIVQYVMDEFTPDETVAAKNKIFYKIGKIFENAGAYKNAQNFYEKIKQNIPYDKQKKHKDIDFDIERVTEKVFELNKKEWNI